MSTHCIVNVALAGLHLGPGIDSEFEPSSFYL